MHRHVHTCQKRCRTYQLCILLELLEGLGKAGIMEIVEDRFMPGPKLINIGD